MGKTRRAKLLDRAKKLLREILRLKRGAKCEICGRSEGALPYGLSLFHILNVGSHPRLELYEGNILLACWVPYHSGQFCHNIWHRDTGEKDPRKEIIRRRIIELRGENYKEHLLMVEKVNPPLKPIRIEMYTEAFKRELANLRGGIE